jgi:sporulation protein YlmC with PRC-barrel domain
VQYGKFVRKIQQARRDFLAVKKRRSDDMKSQWLLTMLSGLLVAVAANGLLADPPPSTGSTLGEEQAAPPRESVRPLAEQEGDVSDEARTKECAAKQTDCKACRASDLIGMSVKNKEGQDLGSVKDLVFDPKTGTIRYAALSRGGILGIGEKLVAVPWNAFEFQLKEREQRAFRPDDETGAEPQTGVVSHDRFQLILDMDATTLDHHPGFKKDSWPESGDERLMKRGAQDLGEDLPARQPDSDTEVPAPQREILEETLPQDPQG